MGVVLPFESRAIKQTIARRDVTHEIDTIGAELVLIAAVRNGSDRCGVLAAAGPLLERCRDRYGFAVMRDGLPSDAEVLASALLTLSRGLRLLEAEFGGRRPIRVCGVYYGQRDLAWFEDGYGGKSGLAVPIEIDAAELARFVRPRIRELRR